ncbi:MAG: ABC transporter permease [Hyphomicrobiaceae bacterium]
MSARAAAQAREGASTVRRGFDGFFGTGGFASREGSPWTGLGAVFEREFSDNMTSARMRLLQALVFLAGFAASYSAIGEIKNVVGEDPYVFLKVFTVAKAPLPSFLAFLGFLIPIVAISLGFDSVNGEFNRRTMSRILAQPIFRDALLVGKFLAGLATLGVFLTALWLFMMGLGILLIGLAPSLEEIIRGGVFLVASIAYGGVWLAIAMLFSIYFRSPATSALASLSVWLLFTVFWQMIVGVLAGVLFPIDPFDPSTVFAHFEGALGLARLSPNTLFGETAIALLSPGTRSMLPGELLRFLPQLQGAVLGSPLPLSQSVVLIWPQLTGLIAGMVLLFSLAYVAFQRQEVRA